jgi:hypothetical protein
MVVCSVFPNWSWEGYWNELNQFMKEIAVVVQSKDV